MKVETLRALASEYRPYARQRARLKTDLKEISKGFAEKARVEGIAWIELRKLIDAQEEDALDDGGRVEKLAKKAEFAASYSDLLAGNMNGNGHIRSSEPTAPVATQKPVEHTPAPVSVPARAPEIDTSIPAFLARTA
jgi:hypothetical protein